MALRVPSSRPGRPDPRRVRVTRRNAEAAKWFFAKALRDNDEPLEVVTDKSPVLASVIADLLPHAEHCTDRYANNRIEADHGRLKARLRPMRGLKCDGTASVVIRGHASIQNLRRGHWILGLEANRLSRLEAAFDELVPTIRN